MPPGTNIRKNQQRYSNLSQAAYRQGRSTTEHTFTVKVMAEWASTFKDEKVYLFLSDMSKAFDTINRKLLIEELSEVLQPDELHPAKILLCVELAVQNGSTKGDFFKTDTGVPQGDCLSAIQFTYYLAKTLKNLEKLEIPDDQIDLDLEYTDDISEVTTSEDCFKETKEKLPKILTDRSLKVNISKTETYHRKRRRQQLETM